MGKKTRKEREEKRDSYATKRGKQKRKNVMIAAGILCGIAAIVGISAYNFATNQGSMPGAPPGAGPLNGEHEHASLLVRIFGDRFDFSGPAFQIKNSWIHFEGQDGTTIHRHASGVTLGYLFETLGITIDEECYVFPDQRQFCSSDEYELRYYVNREPVTDIREYVFADEDRILVTYGNSTSEQIDLYLSELYAQPILG